MSTTWQEAPREVLIKMGWMAFLFLYVSNPMFKAWLDGMLARMSESGEDTAILRTLIAAIETEKP